MRTIAAAALVVGAAVWAGPARAQADLAVLAASAEQFLSALKVSTAQLSGSGEVKRTAEVQARTGLAATLGAQTQANAVAAARSTYGADTGQGFGVCSTPVALASLKIAENSASKVGAAFGNADHQWLSGGGDAAERAAGLQKLRQTIYCTAEERASTGWCTGPAKGTIPAGDTNAAVFMLKQDLGPEEAATAADYIDVLAPLPSVARSPSTADEQIARSYARRQGAFTTGARDTMFSVVYRGLGGDGADQ